MAEGPCENADQRTISDTASEAGNNLEGILNILSQMPNKLDLQNMGSDLKQTIFAETATQELTNLLQTRKPRRELYRSLDLRRRTEDLENRSRRCNIRIRGIPENMPSEELRDLAVKLFSEVLDDSGTPQIPIERIHRVGIQRGNFPRDVLCCLAQFEIKEQILQKARNIDGIHYENNILHLYQDLVSTITQRRLLRPLTLALREGNISYKWGFPFALLALKNDKTFALRYPMEISNFCQQLDILIPEISEWRNYIMGPPEEAPAVQSGDIPCTPTRRRDFTPSRQWRKRLNAQSPTRLPNTPRNKKTS
ncbi:hypothetical protein XELAEV_18029152mg [Xenopus laevis]|uniref:Uncharacterized protein n=1 Tax=Xenopus laevis TaxID=8355 RepID=A0A974CR64_XENLA|nr:hypothetical protein XELAEV_18029152mg [Xenopus laevis]